MLSMQTPLREGCFINRVKAMDNKGISTLKQPWKAYNDRLAAGKEEMVPLLWQRMCYAVLCNSDGIECSSRINLCC